MDFSSKDIAEIISKEPGILYTDATKKVIPRLNLLEGLMGSYKKVAKVLRRSGWLLISDLEKTVVPNVEFFKSCGISMEQITVLLTDLPRFFLYKPETMRRFVDQVDELGVNRSSKTFIYAVAVVGSMTNGKWELKLQEFRYILGFSEDDILRAFRQNPKVFRVSEDKMKKLKEVLLATGKYKTSCIIEHPKSLMFSVEQRYKPRIETLMVLESRHLIESWPPLATLCGVSDDNFFKMFVSPYMKEVGAPGLARRALNDERDEKLIPAA